VGAAYALGSFGRGAQSTTLDGIFNSRIIVICHFYYSYIKGNILSSIPNSKVVLLSFIVLAKNFPKKTHAAIFVTKKLHRNDPEYKTEGFVFNPDVGITN
jgi:hypothetical protein